METYTSLASKINQHIALTNRRSCSNTLLTKKEDNFCIHLSLCQKSEMKQQVVSSSFVLVLVMMLTTTTYGSPFLDQRPPTGGLLSSLLAADDPFRILEQIPFGVDRDNVEDQVAISPARVDWKETPDAHFIMLDIPGIKKEEVKIEVEENRVLRVSGERKKECEEKKGDHWHRVERSYGKFWRQFRLPDNVDMDSIQAKLENGVLTLKLNKLSPDKIKGPRLVTIDQTQSQDNQLNSANVQVDPKNEL